MSSTRWHRAVADSPFWGRAGVAAGCGAMATLAMPPWHLWPVLWPAFTIFYLLLAGSKTWRKALALGWSFGFGYFGTGFAWITNAFYVDSDTFAALAVPAIGGLAAGFALYIGLFAILFTRLPREERRSNADGENDKPARALSLTGVLHLFAFAAVWALVEWWRGWFLTGFPWNPIGSVWVDVLPVLQGASLFGVYGLSLITLGAAASLAIFASAAAAYMRIGAILLCHAPLIATAVWGANRLAGPAPDDVAGVMLRLVQPNIAQADKWLPEARAQHVFDQVRMSTTDAEAITHVLWAETAVPYALNAAPQALEVAAQASPPDGLLLAGALRVESVSGERNVFNSLFALGRDSGIVATFDKAHLVPFGEYMPLQDLIPLPQLTGGSGFSSGPGPQTLTLPGLPPVSPLVCYEIIFAGAVTDPDARPAWLFNLTNDAWFGRSSGPYQHLAAAQMRAAEEGLPVVRVANTGISAVVDSYGRILAHIPLQQAGVLDHALPGALKPTIFARFGNVLAILGCAAVLVFYLWRAVRRPRTATPSAP